MILLFALVSFALPGAARAQFATPPVEISDSVTLDEADSAVRAHLERIKAFASKVIGRANLDGNVP